LEGLPAGIYLSVNVSPEGSALALAFHSLEEPGLRTFDLERRTLSRIGIPEVTAEANPLWTPDGRQIVFSMARDLSWGLYRRNADGTGENEEIMTNVYASRLTATSWSPDGRTLVATKGFMNAATNRLVLIRPGTTTELPLDAEKDASVSPDGIWIAYSSRRSGRREVYIERFPELGDRRQVSTAGGQQPRWSRDGHELYYLDRDARRLMVVAVTNKAELRLGRPNTLAEGSFVDLTLGHSYDVAPDGRLVMIRREAGEAQREATELHIILNWFTELNAKVSAKRN